MTNITRRTALRLLGVTAAIDLAGETAAHGNGRIDRVLSTGRPVPENIAFAAAGDLYIGTISGSVRRLPADRTDETGLDLSATTEIEPYPGGVAGVLVADGRLYTAVNGAAGCVRVRAWVRRGVDGAGDAPYRRKRVRQRNDLYADGDRLLVTESFGGTVYEVPLDCGDPTAWVQNALLNTENFGTNGMRERSGPFLATGALTVRLVSNEDIFLFKIIADRDDGIEDMNMLV